MEKDDLEIVNKKSYRTLWIMVSGVFALVLLVAGTLYAMGVLHAPDFMKQEPADASGLDEGDSIYYPLSPFTVNFRHGDAARFLQVTMTFLVKSQSVVEAVEKHEPLIRNNLLMLLSGQDPGGLRTRAGKEQLRSRVLAEVQKILEQRTGQKGIEEIFFTGFVMQ